MSEPTGRNVFEMLGSLVPGYRGYKEKEKRRDTDQILRESIARLLTDTRGTLDDVIADHTRSVRLEHLEKLHQVKRKLENIAAQIRSAPRGYSSLFETVQVAVVDLDRLYQFDLKLRDKSIQACELIARFRSDKDTSATCAAAVKLLDELSLLARQRDQVITEVH